MRFFQVVALSGMFCVMGTPFAVSWGQRSASRVTVYETQQVTEEPVSKDTNVRQSVSVRLSGVSISKAIDAVAAKAGLHAIYTLEQIPKGTVTARIVNTSVLDAFAIVLRGTGLEAVVPDSESVLIRARSDAPQTHTATTGTVSGRVVDSSGKIGIEGAKVTLLKTSRSTVTSSTGSFQFANVPKGRYVLSVRLLGYSSTEVAVRVDSGRTSQATITLNPTPTALAGVVTTAMGVQERVKVGSDIVKINADSLRSVVPVRSLTDLIAAAQVPGVLVTRTSGDPGAPARIRMRGIGSISQNNDPVLVVDGIWVSSASSTTDGSRLDAIDPASIETIEIVRGPSAATLYGQDAANGVIIITTKKGKPGTTRWRFSLNNDQTSLPYDVPPSYTGYGRTSFGDYIDLCSVQSVSVGACRQEYVIATNGLNPLISKEGRGRSTVGSLELSGGVSTLGYSIIGSYQDEVGVAKIPAIDVARLQAMNLAVPSSLTRPTYLQRLQLSTNVSLNPIQSFDANIRFRVSQEKVGRNTLPWYTVTWGFSQTSEDTARARNGSGSAFYTLGDERKTTGILGLSSAWRQSEWATVRMDAGVERTDAMLDRFSAAYQCTVGSCMEGTMNKSRAISQNENSVYTLRFNIGSGKEIPLVRQFVTVKPAIGIDIRRDKAAGVSIDANQLPVGSRDLSTANNYIASNTERDRASAGWSMNGIIGIANRLYFDIGLRQDLGSAIKQSANYPKLGGSWLISDEPFYPKNRWIPNLRLRSAAGYAAVQPDVTDVFGRYVVGQAYINGQLQSTIALDGAGNSRLRPERAFEFESGLEADLFDERASVSISMARKRNLNNLVSRELAPSVGLSSTGTRKENIAVVVNRTLELSLTGRIIDRAAVFWNITASTTILDNHVARLGDGVSPFGNSDARIVEGYPVGGIWNRPVLGYSDANQDGVLAASEVILGDSLVYAGWMQPRYIAGYSTNLILFNRRVQLNGNFEFKGGYTQYQTRYDLWGLQDVNAPLSEQAYALIASDPQMGNRQNISELRFTSASVTVHAPSAITRILRANAASWSLQGSNLGLWTQYRGRDPAVNSITRGEGLQDNGLVTPPPRRYVFQISLNY